MGSTHVLDFNHKSETMLHIEEGVRICTVWHAGRDSNPQPSEPESDALSIEPPALILVAIIIADFLPNVKQFFLFSFPHVPLENDKKPIGDIVFRASPWYNPEFDSKQKQQGPQTVETQGLAGL